MYKKAIFALGATLLFIAVAIASPVTANLSEISLNTTEREEIEVNSLFCEIEDAFIQASSITEFISLLKDILDKRTTDFPIIKSIIEKIVNWITRDRNFYILGNKIGDNSDGLFGGLLKKSNSRQFILSRGSYNRIRPRKDNEIKLFKQGFIFWRYSETSKLFKSKTLITQDFSVKQRIKGKQIGIMTGFKGMYFDIESKLTGNSYVFIMGRASRARAFDLTPFSD